MSPRPDSLTDRKRMLPQLRRAWPAHPPAGASGLLRSVEHSWLLKLALAPTFTLLALAAQLLAAPRPTLAPFAVFYVAVALASWLGGRVPGLVTTLLSSFTANYFFVPPLGELTLTGPALAATALFAFTGSIIAWVCGSPTTAGQAARPAALMPGAAAGRKRTDATQQRLEQEGPSSPTARSRAEEALRESEWRLQEALKVGRMGYLDWNLVTNEIRWSPETYRLFGYEPGGPFLPTIEATVGMVPPEDRAFVDARLSAVIQGRADYDLDHRMIRGDGRVIHVHAQGEVTRDETGRPLRMLGTVIDITERKRAEEALRVSEERLKQALRAASAGIWEWDLLTGELAWSQENYDLYGVDPGHGPPTLEEWEALLHPEDLPTARAAISAALEGKAAEYRAEFRVRDPRDGERWLLSIGQVKRGADGAPQRLTGIQIDVTDRRRAEETLRTTEARYRSFFENLGEAVAVFEAVRDGSGRVVDFIIKVANEHYFRAVGFSREQVVGRLATGVFGEETARRFMKEWTEIITTGRSLTYERVLHDRHFLVSGFPIDERTVATAGLDITERRRAEENLREIDRRKSEFLGVLSHELRNPLAPIRNSLYILEHAAPGGAQARRAYEVIDRQVGHLARLVDDLLDVTRINRGKIRLQRTRVDLVELVRRTVEDHRTLLEDRSVELDVPGEAVWIDGDPTRLAQVLGNLLNNAAKFTPGDGRVSVSLTSAGGRAVLEVTDTGLGIDSATLARLFEPFAQADRSLDRSSGGLGLGLALVRSLVELHGGTVGASSEGAGLGARFTVTLPLDGREPAERDPRQQPSREPGAGRRVLVVEDNKDSADSLSEALELSGHQVAVAYDGAAGLEKARAFGPEVILCDVGLPGGMDGYALARALRQDASSADAYLVALTGYAQPDDLRRAREAGFDAHLAKPPDLHALGRLVAEAQRPSARSPSSLT